MPIREGGDYLASDADVSVLVFIGCRAFVLAKKAIDRGHGTV